MEYNQSLWHESLFSLESVIRADPILSKPSSTAPFQDKSNQKYTNKLITMNNKHNKRTIQTIQTQINQTKQKTNKKTKTKQPTNQP
jgi:hypothetical protein